MYLLPAMVYLTLEGNKHPSRHTPCRPATGKVPKCGREFEMGIAMANASIYVSPAATVVWFLIPVCHVSIPFSAIVQHKLTVLLHIIGISGCAEAGAVRNGYSTEHTYWYARIIIENTFHSCVYALSTHTLHESFYQHSTNTCTHKDHSLLIFQFICTFSLSPFLHSSHSYQF